MADELPPPLEIPWRLASTTQPRVAGDPDQTSISLFYFEPDDDDLTSDYPDERLVYIKITATISPARFPEDRERRRRRGSSGRACRASMPCSTWRCATRLAARAISDPSFTPSRRCIDGWSKPGIVGAERYEGEADGQSWAVAAARCTRR